MNPQTPAPCRSAIAEALQIVTHPDQHGPGRRALAWRILKHARGQTVRLSTLPRPVAA